MRLTSQPSVFKQAQARRNAEPLAAKPVNDLMDEAMPLYQRVIGHQYFEHGQKVAALAERGAEAVRRTFQRNRLGERDSDRRDLEKPHRRFQAPVVISALGRPQDGGHLHVAPITTTSGWDAADR